MTLWYDCGNGWVKARGLARANLGTDAYLCCPGPSLAAVDKPRLNGPGRIIYAVTTAYPTVRPDIWVGTDVPECYNRRLWAEPFIKIVRGNYHNLSCQGRLLRDFPNVFFADIDNAPFTEILDRRSHDAEFVWNHNTFTTALHLMVWMGARRIHLVGCDFGGVQDYCDDRKLTEHLREGNRQLYASLVKDLKELTPRARERGIELISCTPGSPINAFLPFVALTDALAQSESRVPDRTAPLLHAADAELCQWREKPRPGQGVVTGVDAGEEWLLPWWFENFRKHNDLPVAFADFGMTEDVRDWCANHGVVVDATDVSVPSGSLRKPFALLRTPFKTSLWLELDFEVRGNVQPLLSLCQDGGLVLAPEGSEQSISPPSGNDEPGPRSAGMLACSEALVAVHHGHPAVTDWATEVLAQDRKCKGNREALAQVIARAGYEFSCVPRELVSDQRCPAIGGKTVVCRWAGEEAKAILRRSLGAVESTGAAQRRPLKAEWTGKPTDEFGVMVPVCESQEDLVAWWWWAYARRNQWPVVFVDFGMGAETRRWCESRGSVLRPGAPAGVKQSFRKPFALMRSPFKTTVWTDLDCEVRTELSKLTDLCGGRLGLGLDWSYPVVLRDQLPFKGPCWSGALVVCPRGDPRIPEWARVVERRRQGFRGDQEVLSSLLNQGASGAWAEVPIDLVRSRQEGEAEGLVAVHWSGPGGKGAIRRAWPAIQAGQTPDMQSDFWHDWREDRPDSDCGVIVGLDKHQEWLLDWWWGNYSRHNDLPVLFADFGMSDAGRRRCAERGAVSERIDADCYGWFKKPLALLESPFRKAVWLDADCEVRGPLDRLLDFCENGGIGMTIDRGTPQPFLEAMPPDTPIYNSGVVVFNHGDPVVPQWASMTMALRSDRPGDARYGQPGDQETLALALRHYARNRVRVIPMELARLRLSDGDGQALVMHWTGPTGKEHIREVMARGQARLAESPA